METSKEQFLKIKLANFHTFIKHNFPNGKCKDTILNIAKGENISALVLYTETQLIPHKNDLDGYIKCLADKYEIDMKKISQL